MHPQPSLSVRQKQLLERIQSVPEYLVTEQEDHMADTLERRKFITIRGQDGRRVACANPPAW